MSGGNFHFVNYMNWYVHDVFYTENTTVNTVSRSLIYVSSTFKLGDAEKISFESSHICLELLQVS